jgi:sodium/proline symporter
MNPILLGLILYLVVVLIIGIVSTRRNRTHADFLIANRQLGPFTIALSERASAESAWIVLGLPGAALSAGLAEIWTVIGCLLGIFFSWLWIAQPLREKAGKFNSLTLPDVIASHFGDADHWLRLSGSMIITFFFALYIAAQFCGAGKIIYSTFGLPPISGILLGGGIIVLYTTFGGFRAVVWTDVVQAILMFGTLVILPIIGLVALITSGPHNYLTQIPAASNRLPAFTFMAIISGLSWGLGYTGQPHLLIRFLAINDAQQIKQARRVAFIWAIPAFFGAYCLGIIGLKLYGAGPFNDPETVMPFLATHLLPSFIAGIMISGAMAAMMSTADSQLLVTTSTISEDVLHKTFRLKFNQPKFLLINRLATCGVGLVAFVLALTSKELVFNLVSYAWSGLGASFGPIILGILFWKKITRAGALAGMWTGALSTILWKNIPILNNLITERLASYVLAVSVIFVVSKFTWRASARNALVQKE